MEDKKEEERNSENIENEQEIIEEEKPPLVDFKFKERRKEERKILSPARLVKIVVHYDQDLIIEKWVSVVDISRHGMKIIIDIPLKLVENVKIEFYTSKDPIQTEARIAWCKELIKGSGL
ncbi:MAG: PilZ domain-containing protein, partial [Candidatus Calescibacterium sp.]|nr:PilZ domain-containing protein [Candidatus Calescibacterium sp.]